MKNSKPPSRNAVALAKESIKKIDKTILDNFYKLVHSDMNLRSTAACSTIKLLNHMNKKPELFNENLNYAIERLVSGLSSSRAFARHGYGALLLEILNTYQVSTERLFTIAHQKYGPMNKDNTRDNLIAYYMLFSIVLHSQNYRKSKANSQYVDKIYDYLGRLQAAKIYFDFPASKLLISYYDVFQSNIASDIPPPGQQITRMNVLKAILAGNKGPIDIMGKGLLDQLDKKPGTYTFDDDTTRLNVNLLFQDASAEILDKYLKTLILWFNKHSKPKTRQSFIRQMTFLIRRPQLIENQLIMSLVAKFLFVNSLIRPCGNLEARFFADQGLPVPCSIDSQTRSMMKQSYHIVLEHIISVCKINQRNEQLGGIVKLTQMLVDSGSFLIPSLRPVDDGANDLWSTYLTALANHTCLTAQHADVKEFFPITGLYLFYGLQIIEHGLECTSQLEELMTSSEELLKADPSDGSWADVLTDQIIAILSATECGPWVRKLCEKVFGSLLTHISPTSIELLCGAIRAPPEEHDADEGSEVSSDAVGVSEKMDLDGQTADNQDNHELPGTLDIHDSDIGFSDVDEQSLVQSSEVSDEEKSLDVSDQTKPYGNGRYETNKVKIDCLDDGIERIESQNEDDEIDGEEEEYLDDEQMMKLDSVISDMFKLNRIAKRKSDPSFRLRCLDLVKRVVLKRPNDVETINTILDTVIPLALSSMKNINTKPVSDKIIGMLTKMPGKTKYPELVHFLDLPRVHKKGKKVKKQRIK